MINNHPMPQHSYVYNATLVNVIDGDTIDMVWDLGGHNYRRERFRLLGVNTPELKGSTKVAGEAAKRFVIEWFNTATICLIQTEKDPDVFGRYLIWLWNALTGECLNDSLLALGYATPYKKTP